MRQAFDLCLYNHKKYIHISLTKKTLMSKIVFGLDAPEKNDVHIRHINNNATFFPKRKKNLIASKYCIWKTSWANCLFTFLYIFTKIPKHMPEIVLIKCDFYKLFLYALVRFGQFFLPRIQILSLEMIYTEHNAGKPNFIKSNQFLFVHIYRRIVTEKNWKSAMKTQRNVHFLPAM